MSLQARPTKPKAPENKAVATPKIGAPFTLAALPELVAPGVLVLAVALFTTLETDEEIDEAMLEALEEAEDAAEEADPPAPLAVLVPVAVAGEPVMEDMVVDALLKAVLVSEQERTRSLTSGYLVSKVRY